MTQTTIRKTHTATMAVAYRKAIADICRVADISTDQWSHQFFELGCQFCELIAPSPEMASEQLTRKELGYWDWFWQFYVKDDRFLLQSGVRLSPDRYLVQKRRLLNPYGEEAHSAKTQKGGSGDLASSSVINC